MTPMLRSVGFSGVGKFGSIYVRASLINDWKAHSLWSTFSLRFYGLGFSSNNRWFTQIINTTSVSVSYTHYIYSGSEVVYSKAHEITKLPNPNLPISPQNAGQFIDLGSGYDLDSGYSVSFIATSSNKYYFEGDNYVQYVREY